jgi:hypothetical protein
VFRVPLRRSGALNENDEDSDNAEANDGGDDDDDDDDDASDDFPIAPLRRSSGTPYDIGVDP